MENKGKKSAIQLKKEKIAKSVIKVFKANKAKKTKFVPPAAPDQASGEAGAVVVASLDQQSPSEVDKVEEPTIIRLSRKFGEYGGAALGGLIGGRFGFGKEGLEFGTKYGKQLAEFGSRQLIEKMPILGSFRKGGRVPKTGAYILHKGEKVVPVKSSRKRKY